MHFAAHFTARYLAAIRWFIPDEIRKDALSLTRAQNVMNAVVMAALSGPLYAWTYHALGYSAAARVILTCCAGMFAAPVLMRMTKSIVVGREVFLCAVFFNFSWLTYAMGGVSAPTAGWMVVPPMVAIFLGGFATGMFWLSLTCAAIALIYALPLLGIPLPSHPIQDMALLYVLCDVGLYLVIVFFALLLEMTRTEGFAKLQHALDFLHDRALRDPLTGGYRRRYALERVTQERGEATAPFSLGLLGIADLRGINAGHGQAAGDLVLREVGQCVARQLPEGGAFGRYGDAQLLLILPGTTQPDALLLAERVRHAVQQLRFAPLAPELRASVSIGVAQFTPGESVARTIARADEAFYHAAADPHRGVAAYGESMALPQAQADALDLFDHTSIDPLTGVLSRRVLRDRLGHAMARSLRNGRMAALMLLEVEQLESIRETAGVATGDSVLVQAARHLRACLHAADTLIRLDGGRFVVILEDLRSAEGAQQAASNIANRFTLPLAIDGRDYPVTLAIGIAMYPAPGCDLDMLLERADRALVRAGNRGGNGIALHTSDTLRAAAPLAS